MRRYIILTIVTFLIYGKFYAQSVHFSQLYSCHGLVNPAEVGNFDGNWRFNNNYRIQGGNFSDPYKTSLLGFEKHFYISEEQISAGILYLNDFSAQNTCMESSEG